MDKGVDGFRVDAISYLDKPQDFPDSPLPPQPDGYSMFGSEIAGREGTHAYIRQMGERIFHKRNVFTVGGRSLSPPPRSCWTTWPRTGTSSTWPSPSWPRWWRSTPGPPVK